MLRKDIFDSFSLERFSYLFASLGVASDQISTRIGLLNPNIVESNPITRLLISANSWLIFDMIILGFTILSSHIFLRNENGKNRKYILICPIILNTNYYL